MIRSPSSEQVDTTVRRLSKHNWFAIIERGDNLYAQIGFGDNAGAPPGEYVIEYRDGSAARPWRTATPSMHASIAALQDYLHGGMSWTKKFAWARVGTAA